MDILQPGVIGYYIQYLSPRLSIRRTQNQHIYLSRSSSLYLITHLLCKQSALKSRQQTGNNKFHTASLNSLIGNDSRIARPSTSHSAIFWCSVNIVSIISLHCRGCLCICQSTTCHTFVMLREYIFSYFPPPTKKKNSCRQPLFQTVKSYTF